MQQSIRVVCEVKDEAPYFLFTAICNRKKLREVRTTPIDVEQQKVCKWMKLLPDTVRAAYLSGVNVSILIHNGKGDMKEYKVVNTRTFTSFEEVLTKEGVDLCIPGASYEEALSKYKSFYPDMKKFACVLSIELGDELKITEEAMNAYKTNK